MKTRIIQTRFYVDEINEEVDLFGQHLYLYLLTCPYINICGYFQLRDGVIKLESKLTDGQLKSAKEQLQSLKKVFFKDGWIWVVNSRKNNNYEKSPLNEIACQKELSLIPRSIKEFFDSSIDSSMEVLSILTINKKQEIINNNKELINDKEKEELIELLVSKGANKDVVSIEIDKFINYWTEKNHSCTKERWQLQKTFEVKRRLTTWFNNINQFGGKNERDPEKFTF